MKEDQWKRDEKPYLVFLCSKCRQYSYVTTIKKTKKCLRCNRIHQVQDLLKNGEIVEGMTAAVEKVKFLQNELARKELGKNPDLVSDKGFFLTQKVSISPTSHSSEKINLGKQAFEDEGDYYQVFLEVLSELSTGYKRFPHYLIEMLAESKGIPLSELSSLIRKAFREGTLIRKKDLYSL